MYTEEEARKLVVEAGLKLVETGLIARTWGNISARISEEEFIITPSGRAYEDLTPDDLVKCRIEDCSYEGDIKPSSEKGIHADSYRLRKDINFVIHTHQFYATAVGVVGRDIKKPFIPCAAYGMPSTGKLRKNVAACVESNAPSKAFLMTKHGALCLGTDLEDAFAVAEDLEAKCRSVYFARLEKTLAKTLAYRPEGDIVDIVEGREDILISELGDTMYPAIDDLVQIAGTSIRCVPEKADKSEKKRALKGRNAVFVRGRGAIVTGEDKEAVAMILRKGCAAALYQGSLKGMNPIDAMLQRLIYLKKYSKRK